MQKFYRAVSFNRPVGPWRNDRETARRDLIDHDLGGYDEWGHFWITVPGDLESERRVDQSKAA